MDMLSPRFPPSFDDSPFAYAFALFSLTIVTALSLSIVIGYALEGRREREISRRIGNWASAPRKNGVTLLGLHRVIVGGFLLTIIMGALPDVLVLLAWGEASDETMWTLFLVDRAFDGLLLLPFLFSVFITIKAGMPVDHLLGREPVKVSLRPTWGMVREKLKIVGAVLCISVGVTLFKSGWL